SGVAFSAAKIRSPSFSRSSSSMTMTALPAAMSATALSTESNLVISAALLSCGGPGGSASVAFRMTHRGATVIATAFRGHGFTAIYVTRPSVESFEHAPGQHVDRPTWRPHAPDKGAPEQGRRGLDRGPRGQRKPQLCRR